MYYLYMYCRGALVQWEARFTADPEIRGSNPKREFLWTQEMNLRGSTRPRGELVP